MSFLTSRLAGPIGAGLSLVLAVILAAVILTKNATISEMRGQLTTAQADLRAARDDLTQCRSNRITLEEAARRQNAAVDAAKAEGAKRLTELATELDRAKAATATAEVRAKAILARPAPTGDQCKAADALILETVQ